MLLKQAIHKSLNGIIFILNVFKKVFLAILGI